MILPNSCSASGVSVIPFEQYSFTGSKEKIFRSRSAEASSPYIELQRQSAPALEVNLDTFMPGHVPSDGCIGRHCRGYCHGTFCGNHAQNQVQYPPIAFETVTSSGGQVNHYQVSNEIPFKPSMMFHDCDPSVWNSPPTSYNGAELPGSEATPSFGVFLGKCHYPMPNNSESYLARSKPASKPSMSSPEAEMEDPVDKPYARLIYEALMQAPGHRMMLREIYDWFAENTCKTQGPSVNGWQNSIRHNLSMNQAFENDKIDQTGCRPGRKANSVWFLTDNAIKNGVQSTTRFRKNGPSKRCQNTRNNQTQRQRSGMKGGKATKRSQKLWKHGSTVAHQSLKAVMNERSLQYHGDLNETLSHTSCFAGDCPMTPAQDNQYEHIYGLPQWESSDNMPTIKRETTPADAKEYWHQSIDVLCGDLTALQHDSISFGQVFV